MGALTLSEFFDYVSKLGVITMFAIFVYGGFKQWWVWGYQLEAAKTDCAFYRQGYERLLAQVEKLVSVAEKQV